MTAKQYTVVELAGYIGENDIRSFGSYMEAREYINSHYEEGEADELHVEIALDKEDGERTYEL